MIFSFLFFAAISWAFEAKNLECQSSGKIRFQYAGQEVQESASYCFDPKRSVFLSKACMDSKKCAAWQAPVCEVGDHIFRGAIGSPGFKLCQAAKGSPQLIEFFDGKKWWTMDRCYFQADQSFVDTGILIQKRRECKKP